MSSKAEFYNDQARVDQVIDPSYSDSPPTYTGGQTSTQDITPVTNTSGVLRTKVDFTKYNIPGSVVSDDQITRSVKLQIPSAQFLAKWVQEQSSLPPKPVIRITGSHKRHNGSKYVDFDLSINMTSYILRDDGWNYVKFTTANTLSSPSSSVDGKGNQSAGMDMGLEGWAKVLCQNPSTTKTFSIEKEIINWDTEYLEAQMKNMMTSTNYNGEVSITFPNTHSRIIVNEPQQGLFASLIPKQFSTSAQNMFPGMYPKPHTAVVKAVWPFASLAPGDDNRVCAVLSEQKWWRTWEQPIRNCIMRQKRGWVTVDDLTEIEMGAKPLLNPKPWGMVSST